MLENTEFVGCDAVQVSMLIPRWFRWPPCGGAKRLNVNNSNSPSKWPFWRDDLRVVRNGARRLKNSSDDTEVVPPEKRRIEVSQVSKPARRGDVLAKGEAGLEACDTFRTTRRSSLQKSGGLKCRRLPSLLDEGMSWRKAKQAWKPAILFGRHGGRPSRKAAD